MKAAVVLVLAVFSGCQSFMIDTEDLQQNLQQLQLLFQRRETSNSDEANNEVGTTLEYEPQDMMTTLSLVAGLKKNFAQNLTEVSGQIKLYTDLSERILESVDHLSAFITPYAEFLNSEGLKVAYEKSDDEVKSNLEQNMRELHDQLEPYAHYISQLKISVEDYLELLQLQAVEALV